MEVSWTEAVLHGCSTASHSCTGPRAPGSALGGSTRRTFDPPHPASATLSATARTATGRVDRTPRPLAHAARLSPPREEQERGAVMWESPFTVPLRTSHRARRDASSGQSAIRPSVRSIAADFNRGPLGTTSRCGPWNACSSAQKNGLCSTRPPLARIAASALSRLARLGASTITRTLPAASCFESLSRLRSGLPDPARAPPRPP